MTELHYEKPREATGNTPIYSQAIDNLISKIPDINNRTITGASLALRFPEYDSMIHDCHLTLKYFKKTTFKTLFKYYVEFEKLMPTQLHIPVWDRWVSNSDGFWYEGLVFNPDDHPHLFKHTAMPHISQNNKRKLRSGEKKFMLMDAEYIANEIYIDTDNTRGYVTLLEFLTEKAI